MKNIMITNKREKEDSKPLNKEPLKIKNKRETQMIKMIRETKR